MKCSLCGEETKRNGQTKAGTQRWRCKACDASTTYKYSKGVGHFDVFLDWMLHKDTQKETGVADRAFRQWIRKYWSYWALPPVCEDKETVVFLGWVVSCA